MGKSKYKRLTDLYVIGVEAELAGDMVIWMQALNPYEREEALHDAQVARARLVLALREAGDERIKVQARLAEFGRDVIALEMADAEAASKLGDYADEVRDDPEWKERMDILTRFSEDEAAMPVTEEETRLIEKINREFVEEIVRRQTEERDYLERKYNRSSDEDVLDAYLDMYLDRRGNEIANAEYLLTEMWYGARVCEAGLTEDGIWDHARCDNHTQRVWDSKGEIRALPEGVQVILRDAVNTLEMRVREAKNSGRPGSSSDSSPRPSEQEESTRSTQTATPASAPGTSPQPSLTH